MKLESSLRKNFLEVIILDVIEEMRSYSGVSEYKNLIFVHKNRALRTVSGDGLVIESHESDKGVKVRIIVKKDVGNVHLCFAVLDKRGAQSIDVDIFVENGCSAHFISHCVFPNAEKVVHNSRIHFHIGHSASVRHEETHIHSPDGDIKVNSKVKADVGIKSRLDLSFVAKRGRAGNLRSSTDIFLNAEASANVTAKIFARKDDNVELNEKIVLNGCESRGVVKTRNVLRDSANSVVNSEVIGLGMGSRGHIECTEILMDNATARAYPIVDVREPTAKLTHEAAIGRVDEKQIMTLMCRGMSEEEATEFIVQGILG